MAATNTGTMSAGDKKIRVVSVKARRINILYCALSVAIAIIFLFPIYWLIMMSFKTDSEAFGKIVTYYPHIFTVEPWIKNFTDQDFLNSLRNSAMIATFTMLVALIFGIPAAYGMGRYKLPGGKAFLLTFLITQMLPASLMLTPMYLIFSKLGILNTYMAPALAIASGSIPFIEIGRAHV